MDREFELVWSADLPGVGWAQSLALDGDRLYCATHRGLLILDATNPSRLELLSGLTLLPEREVGFGHTLAVNESRAYLTHGDSISLVDVSDARAPTIIQRLSGEQIGAEDSLAVAAFGDLVGFATAEGWLRLLQVTPDNQMHTAGGINLGHPIRSLMLREGYAFAATSGGGLQVVDVSDPFAPVLLKTISSPNRVNGFALEGTRLFLAGGDFGLHVLDMTDPRDPQTLGSLALGGIVENVVTQSDLAYLSVFSEGTSGPRLAIVDVSNPQAMTVLHRDPATGSYDASVVRGDYLIALTYGTLQIIDVRNPEVPEPVDEYRTNLDYWSAGMALTGNLALLANGSSGLMILDLADRSQPRWIGSLNTAGYAHSPAVRGSTVFLADSTLGLDFGAQRSVPGEGLVAVDISSPEAPRRLGAILAGEQVRAVAAVGETLSVARGEPGLTIVDASDPINLRVVGQYVSDISMTSLSVHGSVVLAGDVEDAELLDVSDPLSPRKLRTVEIGGGHKLLDERTVIQGGLFNMDWGLYAFNLFTLTDSTPPRNTGRLMLRSAGVAGVANDQVLVLSSQLAAYRVATPSNPQRRSTHKLALGGDMAISEGLAILVGHDGLGVFDLSDPDSPTLLSRLSREALQIGDLAPAVAVDSRSRLAIVSGETGTRVVDISTPTQPVPKAHMPLGAGQIAISGDLIFLARVKTAWDRPGGLSILQVSDSGDALSLLSEFSLGSEYEHGIRAVAITEHVAYILSDSASFAVVDFSDPRSPILLSRLDLLSQLGLSYIYFAMGAQIAVAGNHAYVAAGDAGMLVVDVADPHNPRMVGSLPVAVASVQSQETALHGIFPHVSVVGDYAYLLKAPWSESLVVADISNPTQPQVVGRNSVVAGSNLAVTDQAIFVGNGTGELVVFHLYQPELRIGPAIVLSDGRVQLHLSGPTGQGMRVQRSANLIDWEDWRTVTVDGTGCELIDETAAASHRFYRAVEDNSVATE